MHQGLETAIATYFFSYLDKKLNNFSTKN